MESMAAAGAHDGFIIQSLSSWNGAYELPVGSNHARNFAQRRIEDVGSEMFENFRNDHCVEMTVGKWNLLTVANTGAITESQALQAFDTSRARIQRIDSQSPARGTCF